MNLFKKISLFIAVAMSLSIVTIGVGGGVALAQTAKDEVCKGVNLDGSTTCDDNNGVQNVARNFINVLSWVVGIISVIMVIIAGFQFVTSGGDSQKAVKARGTILYAIVGLVIVALAQVIVKFVLKNIDTTPASAVPPTSIQMPAPQTNPVAFAILKD